MGRCFILQLSFDRLMPIKCGDHLSRYITPSCLGIVTPLYPEVMEISMSTVGALLWLLSKKSRKPSWPLTAQISDRPIKRYDYNGHQRDQGHKYKIHSRRSNDSILCKSSTHAVKNID